MLVTCPECSTKYTIDPYVLGTMGRKVRCIRCTHVWNLEPPVDMDADGPDVDIGEGPHPLSMRRSGAAGTDDDIVSPARKRFATALSLLLALLVIGTFGGGIGLRENIVEVWPFTRPFYKMVGLKVTPLGAGLGLRNITWKASRDNGDRFLKVQGQVANLSGKARVIPLMRGHLFDKNNRELQRWTFSAPETRLPPEKSTTFQTELKNPVLGVTRLVIIFDDGRK